MSFIGEVFFIRNLLYKRFHCIPLSDHSHTMVISYMNYGSEHKTHTALQNNVEHGNFGSGAIPEKEQFGATVLHQNCLTSPWRPPSEAQASGHRLF